MELSSAPSKLTVAFATGGSKNTVPVTPSGTPGAASWEDGFPPETMEPVNAGGVPPSGLDFNGIYFSISALTVWFNAGAIFPYDSTFSTAIGGYPQGARVLKASGAGYWRSTVDNNATDPDTGGAGWTSEGVNAASSVYASAQQALASGNSKVIFDTTEFDDGIWDATNKRFLAPYAGRYRITGSVMLAAPSGQLLATQIWKNGAVAKQCFQAPQVSDGNLSLPFDAILNLATGDYVEVFVNAPSAGVNAGQVGSNQVFVFAQCEYIGA